IPAFVLFVVVLLLGLLVVSRYNYLLFHVVAELFSIAVAWSVFLLVWNVRRYMDNDALVFLGIAYLYVGVLDMLHTLAYKGMNIFALSDPSNTATQLWISGRLLEAVSLFCFPLLLGRRFRQEPFMWMYFAVTALFLLSIFAWDIFPDCYVQGSGLTIFKIGSEVAVCLLLLVAMYFLYRTRDLDANIYYLMTTAMAMTIAAEISFSLYTHVYGLSNLIGHFFKILSFFLIYLSLIRSGLTRPYALLFRDLEREKEAVRESEEQFRITFNSILEGIIVVDTTARILRMNPRACTLTGWGVDEANRQPLDKVFHVLNIHSGERLDDPVQNALDSMQTYIFPGNTVLVSWDGTEYPVSGSASPMLDTAGSINGVVLTFYDISEHKRAEKLRLDVERMMRHNLKSPLNGVMGMAQLLEMDNTLSPQQQEYVSYIRDSGHKLIQMIDSSMDIFHMEEGTYRIKSSEFDLVQVLSNLDLEIGQQRQYDSRRLQYYLNNRPLDWNDTCLMQGEALKIRSMLSNLVINALEASPADGTVTITVEQAREGHFIHIHNQGEIPPEIRERFFEPYVSSGKSHGTGLGTHNAWLIARAHGGEIRFTTSREEGTLITVFIPGNG
ncbi:MAG: MASE3 domain-containing protein, partial [Thermodesulfobacteriota bacterium]